MARQVSACHAEAFGVGGLGVLRFQSPRAQASALELQLIMKSAVTKQEATAAEQRKEIAALTAGLQRVSAHIEMSRPTPNVVVNQQ